MRDRKCSARLWKGTYHTAAKKKVEKLKRRQLWKRTMGCSGWRGETSAGLAEHRSPKACAIGGRRATKDEKVNGQRAWRTKGSLIEWSGLCRDDETNSALLDRPQQDWARRFFKDIIETRSNTGRWTIFTLLPSDLTEFFFGLLSACFTRQRQFSAPHFLALGISSRVYVASLCVATGACCFCCWP